MKNKVLYGLAVLASLTACTRKADVNSIPLVQMEDVMLANQEENTVYPGRSVAGQSSNIAFKVSGTISEIRVKPGDNVSKGAVLAVMDRRDYEMQLAATQAEYDQIKAEVDRVIAMYEDRAVTENDYDKARYGLIQITQKLNHHKSQLYDCVLTAPFEGCIDNVLFQPGETVMTGAPVISMSSTTGTEVSINISAKDYLRRGNIESVSASFASLPGKEYPLFVSSLSNKANASQLYEMRMKFISDDSDVTPGMTALVTIHFKQENETDAEHATIPANALFNIGESSCVYCYDDSTQCINSRTVTILTIRSDGKAVVDGLLPGETIVTAGVKKLADGQQVRRLEDVSETNKGGLL